LERLREMLFRGELAPGQPIRQDKTARRLGISPVLLRECLRELVVEGRIIYHARRGFFVTDLSFDEIKELYLLCSLMEPEALRRSVPRLESADISRMRELISKLEETARVQEHWEHIRFHRQLHFAMFGQAGLPRVLWHLERIWEHIDYYRALHRLSAGSTPPSMDADHAAMVDACERRDLQTVLDIAEKHRQSSLERIKENLEQSKAG
jgi:DNA-binding GntR family transcriptional regulator